MCLKSSREGQACQPDGRPAQGVVSEPQGMPAGQPDPGLPSPRHSVRQGRESEHVSGFLLQEESPLSVEGLDTHKCGLLVGLGVGVLFMGTSACALPTDLREIGRLSGGGEGPGAQCACSCLPHGAMPTVGGRTQGKGSGLSAWLPGLPESLNGGQQVRGTGPCLNPWGADVWGCSPADTGHLFPTQQPGWGPGASGRPLVGLRGSRCFHLGFSLSPRPTQSWGSSCWP